MDKFHSFLLGAAAVCCLAGAVVASSAARTALTPTPTAAELNAASATASVRRWERETAGAMFPASVPYTSDVLTQETATRLGIAPGPDCATAVDHTLAALTARYHCQAGLRASYADQPQGTIYTVGVLAFPSTPAASAFYSELQRPSRATALRALPLPGTAAALFTDPARQFSTEQQAGSYVVLVVAGYPDGRSAAATGERRDSVFAAAVPLAAAVAAPLGVTENVDCHDTAEWSC
jgi:hypothetical protein